MKTIFTFEDLTKRQNSAQLTKDDSKTIINGTSDWVNEEEFGLRDCWRWSPDSQSIAYWQMDSSGIKDFILVNTTDELLSEINLSSISKSRNNQRSIKNRRGFGKRRKDKMDEYARRSAAKLYCDDGLDG